MECLKLGVSVLSQNSQFRWVAGIERMWRTVQRSAGLWGWLNSAAWLRCLWFRFFLSCFSAYFSVGFLLSLASLWDQDYCRRSYPPVSLLRRREAWPLKAFREAGASPCPKASSRPPSHPAPDLFTPHWLCAVLNQFVKMHTSINIPTNLISRNSY